MFNGALTQSEFLVRAAQAHGTLYDYSECNYINAHRKVKIICATHGIFEQRPDDHCLSKHQRCPSCTGNKKLNTVDFVNRASIIHNDKYDYSLSVYKNNTTKVAIICHEHGVFNATPANHLLRKSGCPVCSKYSLLKGRYSEDYFIRNPTDVHKAAIIYLISVVDKVSHKKFIKVGITIRTAQKRFYGYCSKYDINIITEQSTTLYNAYTLEQQVIKQFNKYRYFPGNQFQGFTECFLYSDDVIAQIGKHLETDRRNEFNGQKNLLEEYVTSPTLQPARDIKNGLITIKK